MNRKRFAFRFDIDTHKCIRDGVPNLLAISKEYHVPFTFFLNTGKSVSFKDSLSEIFTKRDTKRMPECKMMSAREKLGMRDYVLAALVNPCVINYKKQVRMLLESDCEVGLHGGRNHAKWQLFAREWSGEKIEKEIREALFKIKKLRPDYEASGFASPAWNSPEKLVEILKKLDFQYVADYHENGKHPIRCRNGFPEIGVNLLGEPEGVAFWEYCRVTGEDNKDILKRISASIDTQEITIVYDHPYYAGIKELESIRQVIELCKEKECEIVTLGSLL